MTLRNMASNHQISNYYSYLSQVGDQQLTILNAKWIINIIQYHEVYPSDAELLTGYKMQDIILPKSQSTNLTSQDEAKGGKKKSNSEEMEQGKKDSELHHYKAKCNCKPELIKITLNNNISIYQSILHKRNNPISHNIKKIVRSSIFLGWQHAVCISLVHDVYIISPTLHFLGK